MNNVPQNLFQSPEWERFKLATGYQKSYRIGDVLVLEKRLPLGNSILYAPMVSRAELDRIMNKESGIKGFLSQVKSVAQNSKSIFFRFELNAPEADHDSLFIIHNSGLIKAFEEMQPEHTELLGLNKTEDEILSGMKPKCRYNIKVAEKNHIKISWSESGGKALDDFYNMYKSTGVRHNITYRSKKYFDALLENLGASGYARVYEAVANIDNIDTPLAAAIVVHSGSRAIYLFGSSSDEYKNMMAPYLLHWNIIQDARESGYETYDFFGVAPDDNPKHPWAGVTRFKKQWGGYQEDILGSYDLVFSPVKYKAFKLAEKIRRK